MNSKRVSAGFKVFIAVVFVMSLLGGWAKPANSAVDPCTWIGTTAHWETSSNWSCGGVNRVPGQDDIVIIPDTSIDPVFSNTAVNFRVGEIYIGIGAILHIINNDGGEQNFDATSWQIDGTLKFSSTSYSYGVNMNSSVTTGVIDVSSTGDINFNVSMGALRFYSPYNNSGVLHQKVDGDCAVFIAAAGEHNGVFNVKNLQINAASQNIYFHANSELNIPDLNVTGGNVYIYGTYDASATSTNLIIEGGTVEIDSVDVTMPYQTSISSNSTLTTTLTVKSPLSMRRLSLGSRGVLNNLSTLEVTTLLDWQGGGFTGGGTTTVLTGNTSSIYPAGGGTMDAQTLTLNGTTNWTSNNLTLSNEAEIINNGTFNANATTTMTGTETEFFTNNGNFMKNTADTITTMDIPFINDGTVDVVAGSLVFQQGMDNGKDAVVDLSGGTLDPGETLNLASGDSLIGSGTLAANLVNSGTVSPGNSAGSITVQGDYTQSADGILKMELGGTTAGTQYDQLTVTGTATMAGTLDVSLINDFEPQVGDSFFIIDHSGEGSSGTGTFDTVSLPTLDGGLKLESDFSDEGVTLTVIDGGGSGGSISGTVTCNSTYTVFVDIWAGNTEPPPYRSITINCGDSYSFTDLPDGTYYVDAWIDIDGSGETGGPGDDEPSAWYGSPTAVEITGGNSQSGIDITFPSSNTGAIEGTVTCDSIHPVFVDLWASTTNPEPELSTTIACGGSYSFTNLPNGTYYVGAWIDLNESGDGPPDPGEPYVWYGDQTAVTITGGETKSGIDITFPAESFQLFLPLIVK